MPNEDIEYNISELDGILVFIDVAGYQTGIDVSNVLFVSENRSF